MNDPQCNAVIAAHHQTVTEPCAQCGKGPCAIIQDDAQAYAALDKIAAPLSPECRRFLQSIIDGKSLAVTRGQDRARQICRKRGLVYFRAKQWFLTPAGYTAMKVTPPVEDKREPQHRWTYWHDQALQQRNRAERLAEALTRISEATLNNVNSSTADEMRSWVKAVADDALAKVHGEV